MTQPSMPPAVEDVSDGVGVGALAGVLAAEAAITSLVLAAYASWLAEVAALIFTLGFVDPTVIWSLIPSWERKVDRLMTELTEIAKLGWQAAARDLQVDFPFDESNPVLQDQLRRTRNFMVNTPNEVYRMILRVLDENAGNPLAQQAGVRSILSTSSVANWPARAKTVAVTEVHRAFNFGGIALAMNVGGGASKRWIAKEDNATRPAHHRADGQTQPVFQPFIVDDQPLMAPGDPAGSPSNVINCRCKVRYRRSNGR